MLTQWKKKVKTVLSIIAEETVVMKADQALSIFFLNIDAEFNVISQHFTVANEMIKLNAEIPHFLLLSDHFIYCYEAYLMKYWLRDSWDQKHNCEHVFYVLKKNEPDLIMSLSALEKKQVHIDCELCSWRFNINSQMLSLKDLNKFEETAERSVICTFLWSVLKLLTVCLQGTATAPFIPQTYADYVDVFSESEAECLSAHKKHNHVIDNNEKNSSHNPLYNLSDKKLQVLQSYLNDVLMKSWIQHSVSLTETPVLFTSKKDSSLQLCVNYCKLNNITVKNRHSLLLISETLNWLSSAKIFIKLNLKDVYHCICICTDNEWKTAFCTHYSHFKYLIMSFELANAPATFQAYINQTLAEHMNFICVVYLNNILIYSQSEEEHKRHVCEILEQLQRYKLFVNLRKCVFSTDTVEFLRFIVSITEMTMNSQQIDTIETWLTLKTFQKVQVFLKFVNFYRRFIKAYSQIVSSLMSLLKGSKNEKKTEPFEWSEDAAKTFVYLKKVFMTALILVHFDSELKNQMKTDAFRHAVTEIYSQLQMSEQWHPVTYWLQKLFSAEESYETHDLELLVIVEAFKQWHHYLERSTHSVKVLTDHNNLHEFMNIKTLNEQQIQWAVRLAAFNFVIKHRLSKTNSANALLRRSDYVEAISENIDRLLSMLQRKLAAMPATMFKFSVIISYLKTVCQACEEQIDMRPKEPQLSWHILRELEGSQLSVCCECSIVRSLNLAAETVDCRQLVSHTLASELVSHETVYDDSSKSFLLLVHSLQMNNLFVQVQKVTIVKNKRSQNAEGLRWAFNMTELLWYEKRLYISPEVSVWTELLKCHHDDELTEHFSIEWTLELVSCKYYWPELAKDVKKYVFSCNICQRMKTSRHHSYDEMQALPHSNSFWKKVIMNMITSLPSSKCSDSVYDVILMIVDCYIKMAQYISISKTLIAMQLADIFFEKIVCCYRAFKEIVSDRGSIFTSGYWSEIYYQAKIKCWLSTAFHPQMNEQTECQN